MTWEGDTILPRAGVWKLTNRDGTVAYGLVGIWYESISGTKYVNEFRLNYMPLPDEVRVTKQAGQAIDGNTFAERRNSFHGFKNQFLQANPGFADPQNFPIPETEIVEREWSGTMQDGQGFNIPGGSSATAYGGPPPGNRGQ